MFPCVYYVGDPGGSMNAQNFIFSNSIKKKLHQRIELDEILPTVQVSCQTDIVCKSYSALKFGKNWKKGGGCGSS